MIKINKERDVLFIVDVQNDFVEGSLAVAGASKIIPVINEYAEKFDNIMTSQDWHPADHVSFKSNGGVWPDHCVEATWGAQLVDGLSNRVQSGYSIFKGSFKDVEEYSAAEIFYEDNLGAKDNIDTITPFLNALEDGDHKVFFCGLATDYCVKATVLDAIRNFKNSGLAVEVYVLTDAIAAVNVNPGDGTSALADMILAGATRVEIGDLL